VITLKPASVHGPNEITTPVASRPRAIRMRRTRGPLFRAGRRPASSEIGLEPSGEVPRSVGRLCAHIAEIAGAVARRNIHAAAQRHREMCLIPAHAALFGESGALRALPLRLWDEDERGQRRQGKD